MSPGLIVPNDLVGWWCPSIDATGGILLDRSGRGNHGTLTNMDPASDWVVSGSKGALDFDGVDDNVQATITTLQQPTKAITMCGWVNVRNGVQAQKLFALPWATASIPAPFVSYCLNSGTDGSSLRAGAALALTGAGGDGLVRSRDTSAYNISANTWNFIAATYDSVNFRVYLNGIERDTPIAATGDIRYNNVFTLTFGMNNPVNSASQDLDGQLDDIRIYNRALTAGEVSELWQIGRGNMPLRRRRRYTQQAAGFKAYWARRQSQLIGGGV
jgi:hypothetical protein